MCLKFLQLGQVSHLVQTLDVLNPTYRDRFAGIQLGDLLLSVRVSLDQHRLGNVASVEVLYTKDRVIDKENCPYFPVREVVVSPQLLPDPACSNRCVS